MGTRANTAGAGAERGGNTVLVVNGINQPREFQVAGIWYRWEPAGRPGASVKMPADAVQSPDFESVRKYFTVAAARPATDIQEGK